jgi:hypothetical protein
MCDYSLRHVASRAAEVGDQLISTRFSGTDTGGFAAVGDLTTAVCLLPGTEVVFERDVEVARPFARLLRWLRPTNVGYSVARFRQVDMDKDYVHHDALEFPNGQIVKISCLRPGQRAIVIQLPATRQTAKPVTSGTERLTA